MRGGLIALACCGLVFLIAVVGVLGFYLEEDARGAAVLRQKEAQIEAQGVSLDPAAYYPTLPPTEQNLGALSIFEIEPDPAGIWPGSMQDPALKLALKPLIDHLPYKNDTTGRPDLLPFLDKWTQGAPDLVLLRTKLAALDSRLHPEVPPTADATVLQLLAQLAPVLGDLRSASAARPLCVFPRDYRTASMHDFSFAPETTFISFAKALAYEERLALYEHQPQLALDDMGVGRKVIMGLRKEPFLVSGLIAIAMAELQGVAVQQGLAHHDWNDEQLAQLDADLGTMDDLSGARFWIEGDVVAYGRPSWDYYENHRWQAKDWVLEELRNEVPGEESPPTFLERLSFVLTPKGWFALDRASYDSFRLLGTEHLIDPAAHRVHPERAISAAQFGAGQKSWLCWNQPVVSDSKIVPNAMKNFAFCQVHLDEARIACRLERYRFAHGTYPASLDALVPAYGATLPTDVMNGEAYRYQLRPDGSYLLYSVGWNQLDDQGNGTIAATESQRDALDWVWPSEPASQTK